MKTRVVLRNCATRSWLKGVAFAAFALAIGVTELSAQSFTDPNTLAPSFPTPQTVVDRMLEIAHVKPGDVVYDLGCGDGRILLAAAQRFHAKAVGIEIRRDIYEKTSAQITQKNLADQIRVIHGDALKTDLSPADVVTLYLMTSANERLKPVFQHYLKPTARIVSHDYEIKGWRADTVDRLIVDHQPHTIYLYHVQK